MRVAGKLIGPFLFTLAFLTLSRIFIFAAAGPAQFLNLPDEAGSYVIDNDAEPDVTARVARISFIRGEAQIRRAEGGDWERATLNLPVVEGDEITTSGDARLEIQFDNNQHLRLAENAYLKIVNLKDEGIALSLSLGTMSLRITRFDKDKQSFEIDAPRTTIAVQKTGAYRVDAGQQNDAEIRVSVSQKGEARIYSEEAGFTLKNDRSARIFVDGPNAGEWEGSDLARYTDEFDTWSLDRDVVIAQRLKDAFYDKYYDNDIYGADDLNGYGDWVHTASYGYVWRPYRNSLSHYADWSPYRYGHWRWIPPFGWTWVNDEPWGWATYHHGRWFYDAGYWYWSPYGFYRHTRSWWRPALVFVSVYNNNVCWYPLGYHHSYYNYNYNYHCNRRRCNNGGHYGGGGGHHQPVYPTGPTGGVKPPKQVLPPKVPANAVVAMAMDDFGTTVKPVKSAPFALANTILTKNVAEIAPILPTYSAVTKNIKREIATDRPKTDIAAANTKVGAAPRKTDAPLDKELRNTRVLGGRESVKTSIETGGVKPANNVTSDPRKTGAVIRQPTIRQTETSTPIRQAPVLTPPTKSEQPVRQTPVRTETPVRQPPVREEKPRYETAPVRQPTRSEPGPTRQPPRSQPAPTRQPSVKSEPKPESKPAPSRAPSSSKKEG